MKDTDFSSKDFLLQMNGISKSFSGVRVLSEVHFDLRRGEVHILAGENGAGKSTLIKILAGVHGADEGSVRIEGVPVRFRDPHEAWKNGIAVIHQESSLVGPMSVADNIFLGREQSRRGGWVDQARHHERAMALMQELDLELDVSRPVEEFPLALRQMIEIAKAIAFDARIIVMDEPTSALNGPEVERLFAIVSSLKARGCGIIYISHKMEEIYRIADRISVLRDGRYIGTAAAADLPQSELIRWMVGRELSQQFPRKLAAPGGEKMAFEHVSVFSPTGQASVQINDVSFVVRKGEILGIAGLQGSGNSELLNGVFGTYGPCVQGTIRLNGRPFVPGSPAKSLRQGLALMTNDRKESGLVGGMDLVGNMTLAALQKFSAGGWLRPGLEFEAAGRRFSSLQLKYSALGQDVMELSGGNQQKVVLAKWLETSPDVLFLDEPTRGVDVAVKHEIYDLMNRLTEEGRAIILITSEMPELLAMADRILVMAGGRITAEFSKDEATQERILNAAMEEAERGAALA